SAAVGADDRRSAVRRSAARGRGRLLRRRRTAAPSPSPTTTATPQSRTGCVPATTDLPPPSPSADDRAPAQRGRVSRVWSGSRRPPETKFGDKDPLAPPPERAREDSNL